MAAVFLSMRQIIIRPPYVVSLHIAIFGSPQQVNSGAMQNVALLMPGDCQFLAYQNPHLQFIKGIQQLLKNALSLILMM